MAKSINFTNALLTLFDYKILQSIFPSLADIDKTDLTNNLLYLDSFPKQSPVISKLLDMFSNISLEEKINICKYLKLSNSDIIFVQTHDKILSLTKKDQTDYIWSHIYANKLSHIALGIIAAHLPLEKKNKFLQEHKNREQILFNYIERIKNNTPLIKAEDLISTGLTPGPSIGLLLKEAEKTSINEKINDKKIILEKLQKTKFWPFK
jgi:tRNA nucleotidyltransferase/poly(A) polymerase